MSFYRVETKSPLINRVDEVRDMEAFLLERGMSRKAALRAAICAVFGWNNEQFFKEYLPELLEEPGK
jgi:predicted ATPase